ncbi:tyrosine-type recombinase/integrase [Caldichromatium japonicum]|uniref:tyrosine-type recombinase/integrase n=1 Tax=Caldichromatium japonicum TaxID=2699430 RepID=UPI001FECB706|nr:integrase arm-type DNA-binding domain-containing protein [Caldichromatium japonicum]
MPLTDTAIRRAKPQAKAVKLFDGGGLYLEVNPAGGKWWRWKYRFGGKEKRLSLGVYPDVSLKAAREKRDVARQQLAAGIDPGQARRAEKVAQAGAESFEAIAREWHAKFSPGWVASHGDRILKRLEKDLFPWIGKRPIAEIKAPELLAVLRRIESRGALETAHRAMQNCGQVFRYAVATGRAERDPTGDLRGALPSPKAKHHASITEPKRIGELLRAINAYEGFFATKCALRLAPLVFVRPGELRKAQWCEFDLDKGEWRIPAERMKMREQHIVPLSRQAVAILRELEPLTNRAIPSKPDSPCYVFPGGRSRERPMSENAILAALRRMGYAKDEMTSQHGLYPSARTGLEPSGHRAAARARRAQCRERGLQLRRTPARAAQDDAGVGGLSGRA